MMKLIFILSTLLYVTNALWIPFISNKKTLYDNIINDINDDDVSSRVQDHDQNDVLDADQETIPYINFITEWSKSEGGFTGIHDWKIDDDVSHPPWKHFPDHNPGNDQQNLLEVLDNDERFKIFTKLVSSHADIADKLKNQDLELTVFAPSNCAFKKVHHDPHHRRPPPPEVITKVLQYHIVSKKLPYENISFGDIFETNLILDSLGGKPQVIKVFKFHNNTYINFAKAFDYDIVANNGLAYGIGSVLLPPPPTLNVLWHYKRYFSILLAALKHTGLIEDIKEANGITFFAPPNEAFKKLGREKLKYLFSHKEELKSILLYHVVPEIAYSKNIFDSDSESIQVPTLNGDKNLTLTVESRRWKDHTFKVVVVNGNTTVIFPDAFTAQGTIHVVNNVLIPSSDEENHDDAEEEYWEDNIIEYLIKQ